MKRPLARFGFGFVGGILAALPLGAAVTVCDESSLRTVLVAGGEISFNCDTTILLTNALVVSNSVTLDASSHDVTISGDGKTRVFEVESSGTLFLIGLKLRDGLAQGTNGAYAQPGGSVEGGAIRMILTGTLRASDCWFLDNRALGGKGGDGFNGWGGSALGGAISSEGGGLFLTNCLFSHNASAGGPGGILYTDMFGQPALSASGNSSGGAISIPDGAFIAENCTFTNNSSLTGGAIALGMASASASNCVFVGNAVGGKGGAISISAGSFIAENCTFTNNRALTGGAIALGMASASVSSCVFVGNAAGGQGGAIHHLSGLAVNYSRFIANSTTGRPAQGGAIFSYGDLTIARSQFTANSTAGDSGYVIRSTAFHAGHADGGALCILRGVANITDSTFDGNSAAGGAGCCLNPSAAPGDAHGGAVYTQNQTTIQNGTFVHNAANGGFFSLGSWPRLAGMGGAVACWSGESRIQYSTIASNNAFGPTNFTIGGPFPPSAQGGGVFLGGGSVQLIGSLLSGNATNGAFGDNVFPASIYGGSNLSSDNTGGGAGNSFLNVDPKLAALADNGGPVQTMALSAGSPAIDTASSADLFGCPATDARGMPRGQPNGKCDIGAFEQTFMTIQRAPDNDVQIHYLGVPDETYALEASSNLMTWQQLSAQPNGISLRVSADMVPGQFFRVRLLP